MTQTSKNTQPIKETRESASITQKSLVLESVEVVSVADSSSNNSNMSSSTKIVGFNMFSKKGFTGISKYKKQHGDTS